MRIPRGSTGLASDCKYAVETRVEKCSTSNRYHSDVEAKVASQVTTKRNYACAVIVLSQREHHFWPKQHSRRGKKRGARSGGFNNNIYIRNNNIQQQQSFYSGKFTHYLDEDKT